MIRRLLRYVTTARPRTTASATTKLSRRVGESARVELDTITPSSPDSARDRAAEGLPAASRSHRHAPGRIGQGRPAGRPPAVRACSEMEGPETRVHYAPRTPMSLRTTARLRRKLRA